MSPPAISIDVDAIARKVDVDNRLPLRYYYRIADNLLKQATIYREENNVIDLYAILLRFSSLVSETIPIHRDYQTLHQREKKFYREKLFRVLDELESLKPEFQRRTKELKRTYPGGESDQVDGTERHSHDLERYSLGSISPCENNVSAIVTKQLPPSVKTFQSSGQQPVGYTQNFSSYLDIDKKFQKLSFAVQLPNQETLSRHSFLGQNGLRGQWQGPTSGTKIVYPSHDEFSAAESSEILMQNGDNAGVSAKEENAGQSISHLESVLSLDDGRWSQSAERSYPSYLTSNTNEELMPLGNIRQPSPPPVLAQIHPDVHSISPSRVADPRPGPARSSNDGTSSSTYQNVHIPVRMLEDFLRLAQANTRKNLETCGVLTGSLKNRVFQITTLIIPKQEATSDSCSTLNEEEIFEVQDKRSLFPLGWIHTHPTQTCFMSSVDLHTHYSYQVMLPEAIAIVMAPTDTSSPHGIFHLSDPGGVSLIRNCQQRGFHPHEEPEDGSPLYEHCSHVYMNPRLRFDVMDLR